MNTFFIKHRSPHHAKNSGYDHLLDFYPEGTSVLGERIFPYKITRFFSKFCNQKAGLFNSESINKEWELFKLLRNNSKLKNLVHYLNAERDIRFIVKNKSLFKGSYFCGTFHKPPSILDWRISNPKYVSHLDGAVAVGQNQVDYIKEQFKIQNVRYIPHGIDTKFFVPNINQRIENRLLFVGQHLRDFNSFNYCIPRIAQKIKALKVHVVIHPSYKKKITFHESITIHSNLSDVELLKEYHKASILFLPMLDSTACNSILEALSCGVPIVTTVVGGNSEYLDQTQSSMLPLADMDGLIESTIKLLKNKDNLNLLSILARKKALKYDWKLISEQMFDFHTSLQV